MSQQPEQKKDPFEIATLGEIQTLPSSPKRCGNSNADKKESEKPATTGNSNKPTSTEQLKNSKRLHKNR